MASIGELLNNKGVTVPKVARRAEGRAIDQLRNVSITRGYNRHAAGSCLIEMGDTRVLCVASIEEKVPPHMKNTGSGWITAEYGMLPGCSQGRIPRESSRGKVGGRTHEIQRLIGRSLRAAVDLKALGERTIWIDCDVLQADGGTRTASITGAYIALSDAIQKLLDAKTISRNPLAAQVAAVSVGLFADQTLLDLDYSEDSNADVDMNVIMTSEGNLIEVQGTAEGHPFNREQMNQLMDLAEKGIRELFVKQNEALGR